MRHAFFVSVLVLACLTAVSPAPAQPPPGQPGPGRARPAGPEGRPSSFPGPSWEYRAATRAEVETIASKDAKDRFVAGLNALGAERWELAGVEPAHEGRSPTFLFKRPKSPAPSPEAGERRGGLDFQIYRLKNAEAAAMAKLLEEVFRSREGRVSRFIADPRTNSLLVLAEPDQDRAVRALIEQLDGPGDERPPTPRGK